LSEQIVLGVESAIAGGSICLTVGGREVGSWVGDQNVSKAEELLPNIDRLLQSSDLTIKDLDRIIVSNGPGSFTGIKVGLSTVLGLRAALGVACAGISILQAIAINSANDEVSIALPVGRGAVCIQSFNRDREVSIPKLIFENELAETISLDDRCLIVHASLINLFPNAIDAGWNMASHLCAAVDSEFVFTELRPLFVERKSANI
jgi:tRNA threonylcarbamoyl adenosine modification protein YeaZ